jgi:hypothetical protein
LAFFSGCGRKSGEDEISSKVPISEPRGSLQDSMPLGWGASDSAPDTLASIDAPKATVRKVRKPKPPQMPEPAAPPDPLPPPFSLSLRASDDTLEPGSKGRIWVEVQGDTTGLRVEIDLDGDGKPEAVGHRQGEYSGAMAKSGLWNPVVRVMNARGQSASASTRILVNGRLRLELKVRKSRGHMAESLSFRIRGRDPDDPLARARIRIGKTWEPLALPPNPEPGKWVTVYRSRVFGQVGRPRVAVCAVSGDGREQCDSAQVEIYNAPPEAGAFDTLRSRPGEPVTIKPRGRDPDGRIAQWEWDLDGDGKFEVVLRKEESIRYTFARPGVFALALRVTSEDGAQATGRRVVEVGRK